MSETVHAIDRENVPFELMNKDYFACIYDYGSSSRQTAPTFYAKLSRQDRPKVRALLIATALRKYLLLLEQRQVLPNIQNEEDIVLQTFGDEFPHIYVMVNQLPLDPRELGYFARYIAIVRHLLTFMPGTSRQYLFLTVGGLLECNAWGRMYIEGGAAPFVTTIRLDTFQALSNVAPIRRGENRHDFPTVVVFEG